MSFKVSLMLIAILEENKGGTAFPICLYAEEFDPEKTKSIGNDWIVAVSLTVILLLLFG